MAAPDARGPRSAVCDSGVGNSWRVEPSDDSGDKPFVVVVTSDRNGCLHDDHGEGFAAYGVTAGSAFPNVQRFGGDRDLAAIGMLSGFCGTLMTPMAANFNIVPTALLELPDENAVIKVQIPTALMLLAANILLMYFLVFRH